MEKVEGKVIDNLPALLGAYLLQQQTQMAVTGQMAVPMVNVTMNKSVSALQNSVDAEARDNIDKPKLDEPEENDLLDLSMGF